MKLYLDGPNWEADYFISGKKEEAWRANGRYIDQMFMESAVSAGFCDGTAPATLHGRIPGCDRTMLLENGIIACGRGAKTNARRFSPSRTTASVMSSLTGMKAPVCDASRLPLR